MLVPTFKMETAEIIRNFVTKGKWLVLIDPKYAYFHVPIHKESQHLRFYVDGQTYQFKALPFGLATAPLEFTRVVKEAKLILQSHGIQILKILEKFIQDMGDLTNNPKIACVPDRCTGISRKRHSQWVGHTCILSNGT